MIQTNQMPRLTGLSRKTGPTTTPAIQSVLFWAGAEVWEGGGGAGSVEVGVGVVVGVEARVGGELGVVVEGGMTR